MTIVIGTLPERGSFGAEMSSGISSFEALRSGTVSGACVATLIS